MCIYIHTLFKHVNLPNEFDRVGLETSTHVISHSFQMSFLDVQNFFLIGKALHVHPLDTAKTFVADGNYIKLAAQLLDIFRH